MVIITTISPPQRQHRPRDERDLPDRRGRGEANRSRLGPSALSTMQLLAQCLDHSPAPHHNAPPPRVSVPFCDVAPGGTQPPHHLAGLSPPPGGTGSARTTRVPEVPAARRVLREAWVVPDDAPLPPPERWMDPPEPQQAVPFAERTQAGSSGVGEEQPSRHSRLDHSLPHGTWTAPLPPQQQRSSSPPQAGWEEASAAGRSHLALHIHKYAKQQEGGGGRVDWRAALREWRGELNLHRRQ